MKDWTERIAELKLEGCWTYEEIATILNNEYKHYLDKTFTREGVRSWLRAKGIVKPIAERKAEVIAKKSGVVPLKPTLDIKKALAKGLTLDELQEATGTTERVARAMIADLVDEGLCVDEINGVYKTATAPHAEPIVVERDWNGDKLLRFGVVSDTHFGSVYAQIELLHQAYDAFVAEGITTVYHAGDLTEGERMRPGHQYECYVHGADAHIAELVKNYPKRNGIETQFILGNHDLAFMKHVGLDISKQITRERPDMISLGIEQAFIKLTPNCQMELRHPGGGGAYALSYKPQKIIEAMSGGEKPDVLVLGHFHKQMSLFYRNVHCIQAGTLQAQSGFMRNHNLAAHVGYWIVELRVDDEGQINEFAPRWRPFYNMKTDDWKRWR